MPQDTVVRIGDLAQAATRLCPSGIVIVHGNRHSARSANTLIDAGKEVVVLSGDLHGFVVKPVTADLDLVTIPNLGKPVYSSFGSAIQAGHARQVEAEKLWKAQRQIWHQRVGPTLGVLFASAGIGMSWNSFGQQGAFGQVVSLIALVLVLGAIAGKLLLRFVDHSLDQIDFQLRRFALPTTILALLGGTVTASWAIPKYGAATGILSAIVATGLAGFPLPALMAIISASADTPPIEASEGVSMTGEFSSTVEPTVTAITLASTTQPGQDARPVSDR